MDPVHEARRTEIAGFSERRVYSIRPRREALDKGAKIVGVRWVDSGKNGGVRSRLVCQDFKKGKPGEEEMFAPTPPLLATRWLCSQMASEPQIGLGSARSAAAPNWDCALAVSTLSRTNARAVISNQLRR